MTKLKLALCVLAALLFSASPASAHKVSVFGYVENGWLLGEGYFPGGGKAKASKVELLDQKGRVLATTVTNNQGVFKMKLPKAKGPLKLVIFAGMGHKGQYVLTAQDLGQGPAGKHQAPDALASQSDIRDGQIDQAVLQAAIEKALDNKLAPLKAQIAKLQAERAIGVADVIGGLGYILGLLGLAAYMKNRKQKQD